jgi:TetR/AcrR family transcriptional regulator, copper-responsive repressor
MRNGTKKEAETGVAPRKRGRPRAYDPATAFAAVTAAFWEKGYQGASLDDLAAATGMNRPSLYAAFGDKKAMYLEALARIRVQVNAGIDAILAAGLKPRDALLRFYLQALPVYLSGERGPRGCLTICTASVEAATDEDVRAALSRMLDDIDAKLARLFPAKEKSRAMLASAVLHSLAVRARAGQTPRSLKAMAEAAVETLMGEAHASGCNP